MNKVQHRGTETEETYCGLPVHAVKGLHQKVVELLQTKLQRGQKIADLGAGHGALSLRLHHAGFEVTAFDLDKAEWQVQDIGCYQLDLEQSLEEILDRGPYAAICALEVIEHLENPRRFLKKLVELARSHSTLLVISTPNPLDTFSCITMFTRGIFNWFSTEHYLGGGHISILPYWLISEHLKWLGVSAQEWFFVAPYRHPAIHKRLIYKIILRIRRLLSKADSQAFFEGQTALVVVSV
ncbi:MAG: class I SAM-dependent methyltransferase [Pyrinomonadaceae bacterium]